ncbi:MAG: hypothetical protein IJ495_01520 [Bacteroidales bacterium]|nr:hypothetical protein [Bacteroidales bacterium]
MLTPGMRDNYRWVKRDESVALHHRVCLQDLPVTTGAAVGSKARST